MRTSTRLAPFLGAAMVVFSAHEVAADVPPPAGIKRVGFSFIVKGLAAAPDRVLFAYPCSSSDGAPMVAHAKVTEGVAIPIGRRGGSCQLYSVEKAAYETWASTYKPTMGSSDLELEKLVGMSKQCTGGPTPTFEIPSSDPRTGIVQALDVTTLSATTCALKAQPLPASTAASPSATSGGSTPKEKGCSAAPTPVSGSPVLGALFALCAVAALRRRS